MFIDTLQRHLAVCGQLQLSAWLKSDPRFWHIVSIREDYRPMPEFFLAKRTITVFFEDQEELGKGERGSIVRPDHMRRIFEFVDADPSCPILVHCWAGRSRSTAVALAILVRGLVASDAPRDKWVKLAADQLLAIRPKARPNFLVLRLGLGLFLQADEARELAKELVNEPRLLANRFVPD